MKRFIDIVLSLTAIAILLIPALVIILILKLTGDREAFFFQPRIGINKQEFTCWKFVTMRRGSEKTGTGAITIKNDPRVTTIGKFLRKTKLNELPQFINVLKGDMSLIGPRPLTPEGFGFYTQDIQDTIGKVKPGLTGIGSIVFRDEEQLLGQTEKPFEQVYREDISPYKGSLEEWYTLKQSTWLDLKLLIFTIIAVLFPGNTVYEKWLHNLPPRPGSPEDLARKGPQRILVIGGSTDNLFKFRGKMLQDFQDQGHTVMTCAGEKDDPTVEWLENNGISFTLIQKIERRGVNPLSDLQYYNELKRIIGELDPTIVLSYTIKPVIYGTLAANKLRVQKIGAMITGAGMAFMGKGVANRLLRMVTSFLLRFSLKHADVLIFQNQDDIQLFKDIGAAKNQKIIQTYGSGVDLDFFKPAPIPEGDPVFLLVARMIPEKGVREFAKASAIVKRKHPTCHFQIIGPYEQLRARITPEEVEQWQDECGVEYLGLVRDVRPYLFGASVFVLPSYYREGQPKSILEAMAMGRPIITTDSVGCRETVVEGENGLLVPPLNHNKLADAMIKMIETPGLIQRMSRASIDRAMKFYDVKQVNFAIMKSLDITRHDEGVVGGLAKPNEKDQLTSTSV
ncbi:MAG: sugar transferase [Phycisphaeraceae bacterium]